MSIVPLHPLAFSLSPSSDGRSLSPRRLQCAAPRKVETKQRIAGSEGERRLELRPNAGRWRRSAAGEERGMSDEHNMCVVWRCWFLSAAPFSPSFAQRSLIAAFNRSGEAQSGGPRVAPLMLPALGNVFKYRKNQRLRGQWEAGSPSLSARLLHKSRQPSRTSPLPCRVEPRENIVLRLEVLLHLLAHVEDGAVLAEGRREARGEGGGGCEARVGQVSVRSRSGQAALSRIPVPRRPHLVQSTSWCSDPWHRWHWLHSRPNLCSSAVSFST